MVTIQIGFTFGKLTDLIKFYYRGSGIKQTFDVRK